MLLGTILPDPVALWLQNNLYIVIPFPLKITLLWVIPTLTHYSDLVSDLPFRSIYCIYIFWNSIWHSFWHILWHSFWHLFWHLFWQSIWRSFWHILTLCLALYLAFSLACVRIQARSTASCAGHMVFGPRRDPLHPETRKEENEEETLTWQVKKYHAIETKQDWRVPGIAHVMEPRRRPALRFVKQKH